MNHLNLLDTAYLCLEGRTVWKCSRSTLYRFMKKIGFVYDDLVTYYEYTKSREDVIKMRDDQLDSIQNYRTEGRLMYYQDETWISKNMACGKAWKDTIGNTTDGCFSVPSGKGERRILSHIGCHEAGMLMQSMLLFRGSKSNKSSDYHCEMNWEVFSHCYETVVFPNIAATKKEISRCFRSGDISYCSG